MLAELESSSGVSTLTPRQQAFDLLPWNIILEFLDTSISIEGSTMTTSVSCIPGHSERMDVSP